jgi:hypothetical protein
MDMKYLITLPLMALAFAASGNAQTTKTVTIEKPKGTATKTVTRDKEAGTLVVDGSATRNSDGATATRHRERTKTEDGVSGSGSQTGFNGKTRSYEYDRTRTDNGFTTTGSATDKQGRAYEYDAYGRKTETGRESERNVTRDGEQVYNRRASVARVDGEVQRNVTTVRDPSFKPRNARPLAPRKAVRRGRKG